MSNPTSNFGWQMPTPTDLVTDLPADFEVFGQAVDSTMADLKGGTSGQILSKNSNTDMDFVWTDMNPGDITGVTAGTGISGGGTSGTVTITNSMATEITAKGDLIVGTGSATFDNLAAGANGSTLVADSSTSTGLRYQGAQAAGKNALINGAFDIWQRGTSFSAAGFMADRWRYYGGSFGTGSISRVSVAGVSGVSSNTQYAARYNFTVAGSGYFANTIEGAGWGNGQTVTISFLARNNGASSKSIGFEGVQYFGTGGSPSGSTTSYSSAATITTGSTFVRYSVTMALPTTAGKTFGTNGDDALIIRFYDLGVANIDFTEFQMEIGSVATTFTRAGGTIQGELAACQRYYEKSYAQATAPGTATFTGCIDKYIGVTVTGSGDQLYYRVTKRTAPTVTIYSASTGTSGKIWNNSAAVDVTITGGSGGEGGYSFYWTQTLGGLNASYHYVASAEL